MSLAHRMFAQNVRDMRRMPEATVRAANASLLHRLLVHAAVAVPAWLPFASLLNQAATGDEAAWALIPIATDKGMQAVGADAFATHLPDGEALLSGPAWTSLSTPAHTGRSRLTDIGDKAQWEWLLLERDIDAGGRLAALLPPSALGPGDMGEPLPTWSIESERGRGYRFRDDLDPGATLAWLRNVSPEVLAASPEALMRALASAQPSDLALRHVLLFLPALNSQITADIGRLTGAQVTEVVTSPLAGFVASADHSGGFVTGLETVFAEIVDGSGFPQKPGEVGRLVVTALYSYARPVIRLDLGLRASWVEEDGLSVASRKRFELPRGGHA